MRFRPCSLLPKRQALLRPSLFSPRRLTTLAIETSCDDTGVAILHRHDLTHEHRLLFNERVSSDHLAFAGVHPVEAAKGHTRALAPLLQKSLACLPDGATKPDFVSVTRGPGIVTNLATGLNTAKGLCAAWNVPMVGVHHMQAHALTPRLARAIRAPMPVDEGGSLDGSFLSLLVSGGHTQLVHSRSLVDHEILASTLDTAVGNMLDQVARVVLPADVLHSATDVMYGRLLEAFVFPDGGTEEEYAFFQAKSKRGEEAMVLQKEGYDWALKIPLSHTRKLEFSFSGLGSNAKKIMDRVGDMDVEQRKVLARYIMAAAFRHIADRLVLALSDVHGLQACPTLVLAGGVACNRFLLHVVRSTLRARGFAGLKIVVPPVGLCTDNAAMIAWAGMEMFERGWTTDLDVLMIRKWPLDERIDGGIMGAPGWVKN